MFIQYHSSRAKILLDKNFIASIFFQVRQPVATIRNRPAKLDQTVIVNHWVPPPKMLLS
jgi:hypothetical protein